MLRKPNLTKADIRKIKTVSAEVLGELQAYLESVQDAFAKQSTSDGFRQKIYDFLYDDSTGLPADTYTEDDINLEAAKIGYEPSPVRKKLQISVEEVKTRFGEIPYPIEVSVPLKNKEYALYQFNIGKQTKAALKQLINSPEYKNSKDKMEKKDLFADEVRLVKTDITAAFKSEENPFFNDIYQRAKKLALKKWSEENKLVAEE